MCIRDRVRRHWDEEKESWFFSIIDVIEILTGSGRPEKYWNCLLYTSDAADERSSVDLGGRRIIKKKRYTHLREMINTYQTIALRTD